MEIQNGNYQKVLDPFALGPVNKPVELAAVKPQLVVDPHDRDFAGRRLLT